MRINTQLKYKPAPDKEILVRYMGMEGPVWKPRYILQSDDFKREKNPLGITVISKTDFHTQCKPYTE